MDNLWIFLTCCSTQYILENIDSAKLSILLQFVMTDEDEQATNGMLLFPSC